LSRASDLRDAVAALISTEVPSVTVETTVVPNYGIDDLDSTVISVRVESRAISVEMGPAERTVDIGVAIMAKAPQASGFPLDAKNDYRAKEIEVNDELDGIVETVLGIWTPPTTIAETEVAGHRFTNISQETALEVASYFENGIWFSQLTITFFDYCDEV